MGSIFRNETSNPSVDWHCRVQAFLRCGYSNQSTRRLLAWRSSPALFLLDGEPSVCIQSCLMLATRRSAFSMRAPPMKQCGYTPESTGLAHAAKRCHLMAPSSRRADFQQQPIHGPPWGEAPVGTATTSSMWCCTVPCICSQQVSFSSSALT